MKSSPYLLNERIEKILRDIIDVAYSDESEYMRDKYKSFSIYVSRFYYYPDRKIWLKKVKNDEFNGLLSKYRLDERFKGVEFALFERK